MRLLRQWLIALLLTSCVTLAAMPRVSTQDDEALAYNRQAKIDWRQAAGQSSPSA
jgi:hypothetical protein